MRLLNHYRRVRALKRLFLCPDGKLKDDAKIVLEWLREETNAKGRRLNAVGDSFLFGRDGRFDAAAVAYVAGERRMFDLLVAALAVDETEVFNLAALEEEKREQVLYDDLTKI